MGRQILERMIDGAVDELLFVGFQPQPVLGRRLRPNGAHGLPLRF